MRAKNMHMGASIYPSQRVVFVTGAIDSNDLKIKVRISVPESGVWNIIKAETNLTDESWSAWEVGLGYKNTIPESPGQPICRQFQKASYDRLKNSIVFFDGEIRTGEPILKMYTVEVEEGANEICMNHKRIVQSEFNTMGASFEQVRQRFDSMVLSEIEILVPSITIADEANCFVMPELQSNF